MNTFEKAKQFIYRNARPLDLARWQYYFENGNSEAVLHALSFYQNEDGGFGHGLESDFLNPNSSPMATWAATEIIHEIDLKDKLHPVVTGILQYLDSGANFNTERNQWLSTVPTNNDYPHAIWWTYNEEDQFMYNPTAALAGFIIKYADKNSSLHKKGCEIAKLAIDWFLKNVPFSEHHVTGCFITLYDYLSETNSKLANMAEFKEKLIMQVHKNICHDKTLWAVEYVSKPSDLFLTRSSLFYADNSEIADAEVDFIVESQLDDGSFPVTWKWCTDYKEYEVAANRWKSIIAIKNMRYLKGFGKL